MNVKKKGVFKGLKFFSQIFEEDNQKEFQIGLPTDVKHVAHIGRDGPSAAPPSWMDEFRSQNGGFQSAPLEGCVNAQNNREDEVSEDMAHTTDSSVGKERDLPGLPKTSRRHVSMDNISLSESPVGSPTSHRVVKHKEKESKSSGTRRRKEKANRKKEASGNDASTSQIAPNIPKKARKKKSKDSDPLGKASSKASAKRGVKNGSVESEDGANNSNVGSSGLGAFDNE
ncbi:hypothetical protein V2J09_016044 [Rumex salicifolius]